MVASGNKELVQGSKGLAQSDLRLVALALIAQAPRHGYEIIKLIEEKTADWYSPAPSIVYPTLTNLAEAGYMTASADPPKLYTITDEGRTYLKQNRDLANAVHNFALGILGIHVLDRLRYRNRALVFHVQGRHRLRGELTRHRVCVGEG